MATTKYSPSDWMISVFGIPLVGFKDGTFLKVTRNAPSAKMTAGSQGDVVITRVLDKTGKVEITLQRESLSNQKLSAVLALWESGQVGGTGAFFCKNINSTSAASAAVSVIEKQPDMEAAADPSAIVWTILLDDVTMFNGGATA